MPHSTHPKRLGFVVELRPCYMSCSAYTRASVKSYQLVKVVSRGRAPGKSSSLAFFFYGVDF